MNIATCCCLSELEVVTDWMASRQVKLHLAYNTGITDVYIGFHSKRLVITASWFDDRGPLSDIVNTAVCIHELAHVLSEPDPERLKLPNFGMVRYFRPMEMRDDSHLDPNVEILTEARTQAISWAIRRALGLRTTPTPIKVDPVKALASLPFTAEQSAQIIQAHTAELDLLMADDDVLSKLEERLRR